MRRTIERDFPDALPESRFLERLQAYFPDHDTVCVTVCREPGCESACDDPESRFTHLIELPALGGVPTAGREELTEIWTEQTAKSSNVLFVALTHVRLADGEFSGCFAIEALLREMAENRLELQIEEDDVELCNLRRAFIEGGGRNKRAWTPTEVAKLLADQSRARMMARLTETIPSCERKFEVISGVQIQAGSDKFVWLSPRGRAHAA